jgi:diguanylate cyclase (GGDEF)-like protein
MKLRTSFRGKLLLLSIVPLAVAQIVTLFAVMRTVETEVDRRARESLSIGGEVVNEFLASRDEQLRTSVQVLAADFGLKEAVATGDRSTIVSVLENHSQRVGADVALFVDTGGTILAASGNSGLHESDSYRDPVGSGRPGEWQNPISVFDGTAYQTIAVPLKAPVTIGWIVMGFRIDESVARRLSSLTGLQIGIVSTAGDAPALVASSAAETARDQASAAITQHESVVDSVYTVQEGGVAWLALRTPFVDGSSDVEVVLQRSMQEAMAPYLDSRRALTAFSVLLMAFVAVAAAWVSGGIAQPLRVLTEAARRMISGRYDKIDQLATHGEFGELASSFNAMQGAIADREQRISHQAMHDPLTDLPNRNNLMQHLNGAIDRAKSANSTIAVVCIKLSSVNAISSTLGHSASDQVITQAARHLRLNLHPSQILGHVGTNEFMLVLPKTDIDDAFNTAQLVASILSTGVTLNRVNIGLQTQVGIAVFPHHASGAAELLRNAAIARSEAETCREPVVVYENGREDFYVRQLRIVNDLRGALQRDEVHVYFQPKVALPDGTPCGAEALVRWKHPEFGWLPPDEFIPAAEQAGTIVHLTRFVMSGACRQCRIWQDRGYAMPVSVNLSARDLNDEYLPHFVEQQLQDNRIDPGQLTLEITENTVMENLQQAISVLESLRATGVRISMDDFGTGHSSLAQLKVIPLDELKIDRSFIMTMLDDRQNRAIVKATLELAHNMKLHVVAEGVEDESTIRHLSDSGCDEAQGFFLSKPVPFDELLQWLDGWQATPFSERRSSTRAFRKKA